MHYDYLIVGSGLSGSTIANLLKNAGKKVLVLEKRDDVGGNISTAIQDDIIVHTYGPHIFHTSDKFAWDMFNNNVEVYPFINSPIANCHGEFYHMPFNMNTFHELWGATTAEEAKANGVKAVELNTAFAESEVIILAGGNTPENQFTAAMAGMLILTAAVAVHVTTSKADR